MIYTFAITPDRLRDHAPVPPKDRFYDGPASAAGPHGYFYPGEVAAMLTIEVIDYHQLRRFYKLIRSQSGHPRPAGWSRYTFTDIACLLVALRICGGEDALQPDRRLIIAKLDRVCQYLVGQGIHNPLLTMSIGRRGRTLTIELDGQIVDPMTGQLLLHGAADRANSLFDHNLLQDPAMARALHAEVVRVRSITKT